MSPRPLVSTVTGLGDVRPRFSAKYALHSGEADVVGSGDLSCRLACCSTGADLSDETRIENSAWVLFTDQSFGMHPCPMTIPARSAIGVGMPSVALSASHAPQPRSVFDVLLGRPDRQVGRFKASTIVARVLDLESLRDRTDKDSVGNPVDVLATSLEGEFSVSATINEPGPDKAGANALAATCEANLNRHAWHILTRHQAYPLVSDPGCDNTPGSLAIRIIP